MRSTAPDANYGTTTFVRVRVDEYHSYFKFDVANLDGEVHRATLRVFYYDGSDSAGSVYAASNLYADGSAPWTETGLTWNNAPPLTGDPLATRGNVANNTWMEFDVTGAVTGEGTFSFGLKNTSTNSGYMYSREAAQDQPQLVIEAGSPPPTATPIPTRSRGYLTTPQELFAIKNKANQGIAPYEDAVDAVIAVANQSWSYTLDAFTTCNSTADDPLWLDDQGGIPILYAKALAYHLTSNPNYAADVVDVLDNLMSSVETVDTSFQCQLNFSWGTPELIAAADLIEDYWENRTCTGPTTTVYGNTTEGSGNCKDLFQNWLVKNPYYVVSYEASRSGSNRGAAATNATAYIADYLWDRPNVTLVHRQPPQIDGGNSLNLSPAQAWAHAKSLTLSRMNGYRVDYQGNNSCDFLSGIQQSPDFTPVKSQITQNGIIPEDSRREEFCNVPAYNGQYQNYPQIHLGNLIQQCELMLRRGDRSCYDNVDNSDLASYTFTDPDGTSRTTHLYPGRGSVERAIKAIIVDSSTTWGHDSALFVAYRYYKVHGVLEGIGSWYSQLAGPPTVCDQHVCFGTLTHGFNPSETPPLPPTVPPPGN
ncbi:hypothetical protein DCC79_13045 [bacterium]|nr:hypothetical protein [Chloroflexi bacterium CFX6]RIL08736.1 MAG: hypothetical protein DCC79_13045 [bacterium]